MDVVDGSVAYFQTTLVQEYIWLHTILLITNGPNFPGALTLVQSSNSQQSPHCHWWRDIKL